MVFRFADLPVRTKFLFTLAIPVIGLVLLIGKQVDGSIKRRNVLTYFRDQALNIEVISDVINELQNEQGLCVGHLLSDPERRQRLELQFQRTDEAIARIRDPFSGSDPSMDLGFTFLELGAVRQGVLKGSMPYARMASFYRQLNEELLEDMGQAGRLALDPESKGRLYAHLSLVTAKEALTQMRTLLDQRSAHSGTVWEEALQIEQQAQLFATHMALFERDAPPDVSAVFNERFQGEEVSLMRTFIATLKDQGDLTQGMMSREKWWQMSSDALLRLRTVEEASIEAIIVGTRENLQSAQQRLIITIIALLIVVGAVGLMAFLITRGIRETVQDISTASKALAHGDLNVKVPVRSSDEFGDLAMSFNVMSANMRSMAASADAVGKGNYDTEVTIRSEQDVLGLALRRMQENLKAARTRDQEQSRILKEEKRKLEKANEQVQTLIKEIHHRVKNNLQVIASLLRLQSDHIEEPHLQHIFEQAQSRVTSMALIHEKLYKGAELAQLDLPHYIKELFEELVRVNDVRDTITYNAEVPPGLEIDLHTMVPLGLILNELITNSFKHAFKGRDSGHIELKIGRVSNKEFDLIYKDDGVGIPPEKLNDPETLGVTLIESLVEQLNGMMAVDSNENGTNYQIRFQQR